ncbi:hypothetical protein FJT64_022410 [Amphibalanus amphitrite]|uniref:Uncharacterized protein n=1 Tax=Amphibalanus amphitrite TaxID=1232801 RepID=A0A6A4WLC1_AMPAM|nr:hypothetical protein FJT64_022410 [Amphibalanus amphitrite]
MSASHVSEEHENPQSDSARNQSQQSVKKNKPHRALISHSLCKKISYVTQFIVISFALSAFCIAVYYSISKLLRRQILEGKESQPTEKAWFKFAICLRPFMTSSLLKELYFINVRTNFEDYLKTEEQRHEWAGEFMLDDTLRKTEFEDYFRTVHPWNDARMPVSALWKHQINTTLEAFQEFKVNKKGLKPTASRRSTDALDDTGHVYTVLEPEPGPDAAPDEDGPALYGHYSPSPLYAGCLNITVNRKMARRQMEIRVKFGNTRKNFIEPRQSDWEPFEGPDKVDMFLAADLFVYHASEVFTELPVVKRMAKFSIQANSLERLLVKGASYTKARSGELECMGDSEYSQINCRYWCIMRGLLAETPCALPWMADILNKPWMAARKKELKICDTSREFLKALQLQHLYLGEGNRTGHVRKCLDVHCKDPCTTYKVQLLSLGSKSIGSNYGISLTISPEFDRVTESFDYIVMNMVAELSAAISFLLGLSAIAIYDWFFAFGQWVAGRLGVHRCGRGSEADDQASLDGGDSVPLSQSALLRLQVLHEMEKQREQAARDDVAASMIWHVEPGSAAPRGRRVSVELPETADERFSTPVARSPEPSTLPRKETSAGTGAETAV